MSAIDTAARSPHDGAMMDAMPAGLDGNPNPISTPERQQVIERVAREVLDRRTTGQPFLVAVDGIDGSGKSTFADELAGQLQRRDVAVVRSTVDSFHHPRAVRWSKGRTSPVGFYLDSHDLHALRRLLLDPFRQGQGATYRVAAFDEVTDQPIDQPGRPVTGDEVLVFDGIFASRPELTGYWDYVVFLDGRSRVELGRLGHVMADAPPGGVELVDHVLQWVARIDRYASGMRYYLDEVRPEARADLVIDNNDLAKPRVSEPGPSVG